MERCFIRMGFWGEFVWSYCSWLIVLFILIFVFLKRRKRFWRLWKWWWSFIRISIFGGFFENLIFFSKMLNGWSRIIIVNFMIIIWLVISNLKFVLKNRLIFFIWSKLIIIWIVFIICISFGIIVMCWVMVCFLYKNWIFGFLAIFFRKWSREVMLRRSFGCVFIFLLFGFLRLKMGRSCFISLNLFFLSILFNRFLSLMLMFYVFIWVIIVLLKRLMLEKFGFLMSCLMFIVRWLK